MAELRTDLHRLIVAGSICVVATGGLAIRASFAQAPTAAGPSKPPVAPVIITKEEKKDGLAVEDYTGSERTGIYNIRDWVYTRADMVVRGTAAVWDKNKDTVTTESPIVLDDDRYHITADTAVIDHVDKGKKERTVTLVGHVILVLKPEKAKPQPAAPGATVPAPVPGGKTPPVATEKPQSQDVSEDRKHGGTAVCDKLVYQSAGKISTLTGHVIFKQNFEDKDGKPVERTLTCDHAEHDGKKDVLRLFKPVHYTDSKKQTMDTPDDVIIGTKEGEETIKGTHIKFEFPADKEDDEDTPKSNSGAQKSGPKPAK